MVDAAIPRLIARGFTGIFMDTLDTPPYLEQMQPDKYGGMRDAAVELVRSIRRAFPGITILMNRGYALLPELLGEIDAVVAESLLATYDFGGRSYKMVDPGVATEHLKILAAATSGGKAALPVLSLDYWDSEDPITIREIYARERALGHRPYVGPILLDRVLAEPR
jgi:hypothetical protein